eukprot:gene14253-20227_t
MSNRIQVSPPKDFRSPSTVSNRNQVSPPSEQKIDNAEGEKSQLVASEKVKFEHSFDPPCCGLCPNCLTGQKVLISDHRLEISTKGINCPIPWVPGCVAVCCPIGWCFYGGYSNAYDIKDVNHVGLMEPCCCCLPSTIGISMKGSLGSGFLIESKDKAAMGRMKAALVACKLLGLK